MRPLALTLAIVTAASAAQADPVAVFAARGMTNGPTAPQASAVADAVAEVLSAQSPEVLSGVETATRVEALAPASMTCAAPACARDLASALHARAVVLVDATREGRHGTVRLTLVSVAGESLASPVARETVGSWDDVVALARVLARELVTPLRTLDPPAPTATPAVVPTTVEPVTAPRQAPMETRRYRRWPEAITGGALLAAGATLAVIGLVSVARDGTVANDLGDGREEVYVTSTRDSVFLGVGVAAVAGGAALLIDGLRWRSEPVERAGRVRPVFAATGGGGYVGLSGRW
ncbi:MAG: hypothetical protein R3A52_22140 [Polyangiales bacterium]